MDWRLRLPGALYRQAVDRAGSDRELSAVVRQWITDYVEGRSASQALASRGGVARRDRMTPEQRADAASRAAQARWHR